MTIGCLLPILAVGAFTIFGFNQKTFLVLLTLACPLGHLFMMKGHSEKHDK